MKRILSITIGVLLAFAFTNEAKAQSAIYTQDFNSTSDFTLPGGWVDSTGGGDMYVDDPTDGWPACTVSGSSAGNMLVINDGVETGNEAVTFTLSTVGQIGISIKWNENRWTSSSTPALNLYYSIDGTTFVNVPYTDITADGNWYSVGSIALPSAVNSQSVVYIKLAYNSDGNFSSILLDDIAVSAGSISYYYKGTGAINSTANWSSNSNGVGGSAPTDFITSGQNFYIQNASSVSLTAATWTVGGTGNGLFVGDGTVATNFTIGSTGTLTLNNSVLINVQNNSTLTLQNATIPSFTAATGSTIDYGISGTATITPTTYYNLTVSNSTGAKSLSSGTTTVNGALTINSGCIAKVTGATSCSFILNGSIAGAGAIQGGNSKIIIGGTGAFGTITFTTSLTLNSFQIARTGGGFSVQLGSDLTVSNAFTHATSGVLDLNGHKLSLTSPSTSTLPASAVATITGSSTSSLSFAGSIAAGSLFMTQTSAATRKLSVLTFNKSGATLTLGNELDIVDSLVPTSGTLASGGNLNLIADQSTVGHTGRIGVVGTSASITGNIVSQVYHAPNTNNTDWRLMGVAGISNATFSSWNSQFAMSCPTCPITAAQAGGFSSVTGYSESAGTYPDITYSGTITPGIGYWVYLGTAAPSTASSPILISVTGTAATGNITTALTSSGSGSFKGYNLIANPYASTVSFTKLKAVNPSIDGSWYTYSPAYGDNAVYTIAGNLSSPSYTHGGTGIDATIPAGMGFYVHTSSALTFTFTETSKATGSNEELLREANPNNVQTAQPTYFRMQMSGNNMMNEAVVRFDANATTGFDGDYDVYDQAPGTAGWLQISSSSLGKAYTINSLPDLTQNYSIPVTITCGTTGQYQFTATDLQNMPTGACIKLHDNYLNADYDLRNSPFNLTITDTETVARFVLNITIMPLTINTSAKQPSCNNTSDGLLTAVGTNAGPWNYTWKDGNGNVIKTTTNKVDADSLANLNAGNYSVVVNTAGGCDNATQTFTVTAPTAASSAFTTGSASVLVGNNVSLTNNSTNATNYYWNFGDGNSSNTQTPTYAYNTPGVYTITLDAINAPCNDTVFSQQTITVNATTGISQVTGDGNIILSKDISGNYLQFNYVAQTKVNIAVYNVLGQTVLENATLSVVNDRIYLNVTDNKNQVLYATITNLTNNQQTTIKFVNN